MVCASSRDCSPLYWYCEEGLWRPATSSAGGGFLNEHGPSRVEPDGYLLPGVEHDPGGGALLRRHLHWHPDEEALLADLDDVLDVLPGVGAAADDPGERSFWQV